MTLQELAKKLNLSVYSLRRKVRSGILPRNYKMIPISTVVGVKKIRHLWFTEKDLEDYLKKYNET